MAHRILAINPGSTSTKIAVYDDEKQIFIETLRHTSEELAPYKKVAEQFEFRKRLIVDLLKNAGIEISSVNAVVGRGGLVKPIPSGVYEVNDALVNDLVNPPMGEHASNLGGLIARDIAREIPGARAFIADPVVVDELQPVARISGLPQIPRTSIFHALNQKAIARVYASRVDREYEDLNLIVAHLGGGISVGAHCKGQVIDVNNALDGEGPFSPERSGTLQAGALVDLCYSGKYTHAEARKLVNGKAGLVAHFGTNSAKDISDRAEAGDKACQAVVDAMSYNIAKYIGMMAVVLKGRVDAILITGGIAYDKYMCQYIKEMTQFIAPVEVFPGEDEMGALASNGLRVISGKVEPKIYR